MAINAEKPHSTKVGRYRPVCFGPSSWWRFSQDRRRRYLSSLPAPPDERQALAIEQLIEAEWLARRAEHDAENAASNRDRYYARRLGADMRKQTLLWLRELNAATAGRRALSEPTAPPQPDLHDFLNSIAARRSEQAAGEDEEDAA